MKKPTVAERRIEILEVTCEVVIERGFAATRIGDVAKRLDVSSSLIHYHFDSKEQLLAEAFAHYARKDLAEMEAEVEAAPTSVAQLDRAIRNYVPEGSGDVEWMLWIDGWGEALRNPMMRRISQELDEQSAGLLARVIRHGVERGDFACADPDAAALRLTAAVDGLAVQFAAHDRVLTRDQLIDHVRTLAAWEVGLEPDALRDTSSSLAPTIDHPSPITDTALRQLIARHCDAVVRHDVDNFRALWTPDARWSDGTTELVGRDDIAAEFDRRRSASAWFLQTAPNMVFEVDEHAGNARGRVTVIEQVKRTRGAVSHIAWSADDRYTRRDGTWRFAERHLTRIAELP
ncbi:MAG: TetR family transcriptional regulator C-terminal domain-containing protein [Ilumatobacteraceae bacterium]